MNEVLSKIEFWRIFTMHEVGDIEESQYEEHLKELQENCTYKEKIIEYEFDGKQKKSIDKVVEFEFNCGLKYSLLLEYTIDYSCDQAEGGHKLFLKNKITNEKKMMGWLDVCQWHPMCIAPEEFRLLLKYWNQNDRTWKNTVYPKLLLKGYVGLHNPDEAVAFKEEIIKSFHKLDIKGIEDYSEDIFRIVFYGSNKYKWLENEDLGWVYESEIYNCYSIRNECHSKSENEIFPFNEWKEMIKTVERELGMECNIKSDEGDWEVEEPTIINEISNNSSVDRETYGDGDDLPF